MAVDQITLNITHNVTNSTKTKPKQTPLKPLPKKKGNGPSTEFDFQFNIEKPKVKAIAVRRRLPNKSNNNDIAEKPKPDTDAGPSKKEAAPSSSIKDIIQSAPVHTDGELLLNITTTPFVASTAVPKPKTKISRLERLSKKRAERRGQAPSRVLSKEELGKALKRTIINPNKQPRPGDLFKAQLENEREKKRAAEADEVQASGETQAQVDDDVVKNAKSKTEEAKANNRFRTDRPTTKKVGLFDQSDVAALQQLGQRAVKPIKETIFSNSMVASLGLHPHAVKNLQDLLAISKLTRVQEKTIPKVLAGMDVLVRSQTGSGKTLAYALPIVELLQAVTPKIKRADGVFAMVIVPTRELAIQTYELFQKLLKPYIWITPGVLLGGENRQSEKARLRKGINILMGTPGRLVDHLLHTATFKLGKLRYLVIDEADRLMELGYERDVKQLVDAIQKQREDLKAESEQPLSNLQFMLLSATLTNEVKKLASLTLTKPIFIDNSDEATAAAITDTPGYEKSTIETHAVGDVLDGLGEYQEDVTGVLTIPENLQLSYVVVPPKLRLVTIAALLAKELRASPKSFKAIVFMSTMEMVNFHHDLLNEALTLRVMDDEDDERAAEEDNPLSDAPLLQGLRFYKLHGSMTQTERQGVFNGFRKSNACVLLATDVVGRGIDVVDIKLVVQYSPPQKTADFVHRVGRTARAGRHGRAVLFLAPSEVQFVRHLEDKRIRIQQGDMYSYLQTLVSADSEARNVQEAASNLQHKFQELVEDDQELHEKGCKAFVSWLKFYATFPKELKPIFGMKVAHMGHFAKSFGLKEAPSKFAKNYTAPKPAPPTNRLTYTERDPEKMKQEKHNRRLRTTTVTGGVRNMQAGAPAQLNQKGLLQPAKRSNAFMKALGKSRALTMSEFDSGLPEIKKRKK
ncbi:probable ATP-dependent RNA helicase CG8611 [Scaptodrosophila lebanonensis]|uniref:ATP-dependent RNA helicase n=1 Tax=Drosophila lebanonensis TaxID=7225 RepID=A0A6J2TWA5_DROLE|nr:probable ATP-dependent RNA helicase CG8611 [Scaptodrosophila lebanonensis]